jgi:hypothetical protein
VAVILAALRVKREAGGLICPCCGCRFEVCEDPAYGVSVRCINEGCRLGEWRWPEWALADVHGCGLDEARRSLLDAGRQYERQRVGLTRDEAAVERFNELRAVR